MARPRDDQKTGAGLGSENYKVEQPESRISAVAGAVAGEQLARQALVAHEDAGADGR